MTAGEDVGDVVRALDRGLAVLRAFDDGAAELTAGEVARSTGLSRAVAGRFLHTLTELGYVGTAGRSYHLRPRVLDLGFAFLTSLSLTEIVHPYLVTLSEQLERSTSLARLDGGEVVYLDRIARRRILAVGIRIGTRLPAAVTSQGRMLLACADADVREAYLAQVVLEPRTASSVRTPDALRARIAAAAEQGWCLVEDELGEGVSSVSVPLRDARGVVVAAVNVAELSTAPGRRLDEVALGPLRTAAAEIENDLRLAGVRA